MYMSPYDFHNEQTLFRRVSYKRHDKILNDSKETVKFKALFMTKINEKSNIADDNHKQTQIYRLVILKKVKKSQFEMY